MGEFLRETRITSVFAREGLGKDLAKPTVTVVICAYTEQRWDDLVRAVASVQRQTEPPDEIVLVIDYCPGLLQRATQGLQGVTVCANRYEKGLSGARNTGISVATCDVVAFLDDDAAAAPNWIAALVAPYADPRVIGVGGRVLPNWRTERPRWFASECRASAQMVAGAMALPSTARRSARHQDQIPFRGLPGRPVILEFRTHLSFRRPPLRATQTPTDDGLDGRIRTNV